MKRFLVTSFLAMGVMSLTTAHAAVETKVVNIGGFVDAQGHFRGGDAPGSDGFILNDAAIYLSKEFKGAKFMIDLPFAYDDTQAGAAGDNSFRFAKVKAQAYVGFSVMDGQISATLGQFDTPFGFELNDSVDNMFTRTGLLYEVAGMPFTHTGAMVNVAPHLNLGTVEIKALISDPINRGKKSNEKFEYGGQLSFKNDMLRGAAGYLIFDRGSSKRHFADFLAGLSWEMLTLDAEFTLLKDKIDTADKWATGVLINAGVKVHDMITLGARGEMGRKLPKNWSTLKATFGPQVALTEEFKVKTDYTWTKGKVASGATEATSHEIALAGVYKF